MQIRLLFLVVAATLLSTSAFHHWHCRHPASTGTRLHGISEWRSNSSEQGRQLGLLPFSLDEALLVGQSQTLVFKEGRFFDLLDEAIDQHCGMVGAVIMGDDQLLDIVPLCEVTAYALDAGYCGKVTATVTLKCVGRARLDKVTHHKPTLQGRISMEVVDEIPSKTFQSISEFLTEAEHVVQDIEQLVHVDPTLSNLYQQGFWQALAAVDYKPTSFLFTRGDPTTTNRGTTNNNNNNTHKELHAVSWSALGVLWNPSSRYQGLEYTNVLERLQWARRCLLQEQVTLSSLSVSSSSSSTLSSSTSSSSTSTTTSSTTNSATTIDDDWESKHSEFQ